MLQNIIKYTFFILLFSTLLSCGNKKSADKEMTGVLPTVNEEVLIHRLDSLSENRPEYFYTKLSSKYSDSKYNVNFKTSIRMRSDSALHALITFARIPIYNTMVTPDTLTMVDKRNNCFLKENMDYLKKTFGVDFEHKNIEELILGMPIAWNNNIIYEQIDDPYHYVIASTSKRKEKQDEKNEDVNIRYYLTDKTDGLKRMIIESPNDTTTITVNYYGHEMINGFSIPTEGDIKVDAPREEIFADFKYNKTSVDEPRVLYLAIPEKYERCE